MSGKKKLVIVALAALAGGCAHEEWHAHRVRDYGLVDTDRTLEQRVRFELNRDREVAASAPDVLVSAQNGTVTLSGSVASEATRRQIDTIVRNTSGVEVVNDQLQLPLAPTGTSGRPARIYASPPEDVAGSGLGLSVHPATEKDRFLAERVAHQLHSTNLPIGMLDSVSISAAGTVVTLQGTVANEQQRQAIISAIEQTPGVTAVSDQTHLK